MNVRKSISLVILFCALLALPSAGRYAAYYTMAPARPPVVRPALDGIEVPTPPASPYSDETISAGDGVVVVDLAHSNQVEMAELDVLAGRLATRGHRLAGWDEGGLPDALRQASAFLVIAPIDSYHEHQVQAVKEFVASGGRLMLAGDPTRYAYVIDDWGWITGVESDARHLNSLGTAFGVTFMDDYLYNVSDNEGNFRNIRLRDFEDGELTTGLDTVVFYAAHSLAVADDAAVIRADKDTWSSATDRAGGLVVAAQTAGGQVLALGDLTFMTEPYHTVWSNGQLIAQIADFLTDSSRTWDLNDFPLMFGQETRLVFPNNPELGPGLLFLVDDIEETFETHGRSIMLAGAAGSRTDALFAGLYSQSGPVSTHLASFGVTLTLTPTLELEMGGETGDPDLGEGQVRIENLGGYKMSGIALLLYARDPERQMVTVLAASREGLINTLGRLQEGDYYDCVSVDSITLCPTGVPFEPVEMKWYPIKVEPEAEPDDGPPPEAVQGYLVYGETASDQLGTAQEHLWRFYGTEGDVVTIRAEPASIMMDLALSLEDVEGVVLATADDRFIGAEEIGGYELPATDGYNIRVQDYGGSGGSYTLMLELDTGEGETAGGVIVLGETVAGLLAAGQEAVWTFDGQADQAIIIILQPSEGRDAVLTLQDAEGEVVVASDSGYRGDEERIEGRLPAAGSYRILVREFYGEPMEYTLTLEEGEGGGLFSEWQITNGMYYMHRQERKCPPPAPPAGGEKGLPPVCRGKVRSPPANGGD